MLPCYRILCWPISLSIGFLHSAFPPLASLTPGNTRDAFHISDSRMRQGHGWVVGTLRHFPLPLDPTLLAESVQAVW